MELLILIYGIAFIAIIYYMTNLTPMNKVPMKKTDIKVVSAGEPAWPWTTQHSFWNHWFTNGFPSENCIPIGDYDEPSDSITYYPDWLQRVQPNLEAFRSQIKVIERDKLRENVSKPQKPRKAAPNPRKGGRAKSVKSE